MHESLGPKPCKNVHKVWAFSFDANDNLISTGAMTHIFDAANHLATLASQVGLTAGTVMKVSDLLEVVGNVGSGMDVADARICIGCASW